MAARVTEKGARIGKVVWQKTGQRAARQKRNQRHKVFAIPRCDDRKLPRANRAQSGTKAVHVVHEIEGVDDCEYPQNGNGVTERDAGHEERDAFAGGRDQ